MNWEFRICQVMIAIGFVQTGPSPCIYRHLEKQLCVWVHGDDFVLFGYIINSDVLSNCKNSGLSRIEKSLEPWIPRLCAKQSSAEQECGKDRCWHHLGGRFSTCRARQEMVRRDWPISWRHLASETNSTFLEVTFRSTKKRQISIV